MATFFGDLQHTAIIGQAIVPVAALTASANGAGVDMILGDANNFNFVVNVGLFDITSGNETYVITVTESDDNVTFVPLATPVSITLSAGTSLGTGLAQIVSRLGMRSKRYLRAEIVIGGTTPSLLISGMFIERLKISGSGGGNFSA